MQHGTYRIIPVKAKGHTVFALVSPDDYEALARFKWFRHSGGYAVRNAGGEQPRVLFMHREILGLVKGDSLEADHVNRDRLDNRRCNLRATTRAMNGRNLSMRGGTSRFRGVSWHRAGSKWQAKAKFEGRSTFLGLHVHEKDAATAVNAFWVGRGYDAPNDLSASSASSSN